MDLGCWRKRRWIEPHPDGAGGWRSVRAPAGWILAERPDLGRALGDMDRLGTLPEGGYFEELPWDEDLKWLLERIFNTHTSRARG